MAGGRLWEPGGDAVVRAAAKANRAHGLRIEREPGPWVAEGINRSSWYKRGHRRGRVGSQNHANRHREAARVLGRTYRAVMARAQFIGARSR